MPRRLRIAPTHFVYSAYSPPAGMRPVRKRPLQSLFTIVKTGYAQPKVDSSTVSTGLSTISTAIKCAISRMFTKLSTLSTVYPQGYPHYPPLWRTLWITFRTFFTLFTHVAKMYKLTCSRMFAGNFLLHSVTNSTVTDMNENFRCERKRKIPKKNPRISPEAFSFGFRQHPPAVGDDGHIPFIQDEHPIPAADVRLSLIHI